MMALMLDAIMTSSSVSRRNESTVLPLRSFEREENLNGRWNFGYG
jgi:hypothetical protein